MIYITLTQFIQRFHDLDIGILRSIFEGRNTFFDPTFIFITNSVAAIAFGMPSAFLIYGLLKKKKRLWYNAVTILVPVAISAVVANILKFIINMPRPYEVYPFIEKLSNGGSPSFPSGHTADAFAFAIALSLVIPKWSVITIALIWASLVGISRMWLGVHFPSDVVAGAIIGMVSSLLFYKIGDRKYRENDSISSTK